MGDSDDEFDRRRRDKFRRERSDMERSREREERRRDDWPDRCAHLSAQTPHCDTFVCVCVRQTCVNCVCSGTGTAAERGGGTTIVVAERDSLRPDTSARSTNA